MIRLDLCVGNIEVEPHENGLILTSTLSKGCPFCGKSSCYFSCDASVAEFEEGINPLAEDEEEISERRDYNCSIDGIHSLILNCADQGIKIDSPEFQAAVQATIERVESKFLSTV